MQIREKDLPDRDLYQLAAAAVKMARNTGTRILVNGRADIALAAGAHGVHLPAVGLQSAILRSWVSDQFLVGISVHSVVEARRAAAAGADYVLFGPVFPTVSKMRYGPPLGLAALRRVCASVRIPVIGLGGIHPESVPSVLAAGAAGIAGISLFQQDVKRLRLTRAALKLSALSFQLSASPGSGNTARFHGKLIADC